MNRRHFLRATAAAVGALTLDPERLLWVPGQRTYFDIVHPVLTFHGHPVLWDDECDGRYIYNRRNLKLVYLKGYQWGKDTPLSEAWRLAGYEDTRRTP